MNIDDIAHHVQSVPLHQGRRIIAIAGAPASGKSTLAELLASKIVNAAVIPMDGFHRDNADLERHGLLARKGAPETFDSIGFVSFVGGLRHPGPVVFPTFDRANDCVVPNGGHLSERVETILVEGNYLLLKAAPWDRLAETWDFSVMMKVSTSILQTRLVERWVANDHSADDALARANINDMPNGVLVRDNSFDANLTVQGFWS